MCASSFIGLFVLSLRGPEGYYIQLQVIQCIPLTIFQFCPASEFSLAQILIQGCHGECKVWNKKSVHIAEAKGIFLLSNISRVF